MGGINKAILEEMSFRRPMKVTQVRMFPLDGAYPVCPQCNISLEREYQRFCDRCGQRLDWKNYKKAEVIYAQRKGRG